MFSLYAYLCKKRVPSHQRKRPAEVTRDVEITVANHIRDLICMTLSKGDDALLASIGSSLRNDLWEYFYADEPTNNANNVVYYLHRQLLQSSVDLYQTTIRGARHYLVSFADNAKLRQNFSQLNDPNFVYSHSGTDKHPFYQGKKDPVTGRSDYSASWAYGALLSGAALSEAEFKQLSQYIPIRTTGLLLQSHASAGSTYDGLHGQPLDRAYPHIKSAGLIDALRLTSHLYIDKSSSFISEASRDLSDFTFSNINDILASISATKSIRGLLDLLHMFGQNGYQSDQLNVDGTPRYHYTISNTARINYWHSEIQIIRAAAEQLDKLCSVVANNFDKVKDRVSTHALASAIDQFFSHDYSVGFRSVKQGYFPRDTSTFMRLACCGLRLSGIARLYGIITSERRMSLDDGNATNLKVRAQRFPLALIADIVSERWLTATELNHLCTPSLLEDKRYRYCPRQFFHGVAQIIIAAELNYPTDARMLADNFSITYAGRDADIIEQLVIDGLNTFRSEEYELLTRNSEHKPPALLPGQNISSGPRI